MTLETETVIYAPNQPVSIDKSGIVFRDKLGTQKKVYFHDCVRGWVEFVNASPEFETTDLAPNETVCVGVRSITKYGGYVELTSTPRIRIVFRWSLQVLRPKQSFRKFIDTIGSYGWRTYDLA